MAETFVFGAERPLPATHESFLVERGDVVSLIRIVGTTYATISFREISAGYPGEVKLLTMTKAGFKRAFSAAEFMWVTFPKAEWDAFVRYVQCRADGVETAKEEDRSFGDLYEKIFGTPAPASTG